MAGDRCVLVTNGNLLSLLSLSGFLRERGELIQKVFVTRKLPSQRSNVTGLLKMLRRTGWPYAYFKVWINAIVPARFRRLGLPGSVGDYLDVLGLPTPVEAVESVNTRRVISEVLDLAPELLLSCSATERFNQELLDAPTRGAVNVHFGALPAYAGLSPYFWHLANREREFGVTLHRMDLRLDAGPIIDQVHGDLSSSRSALDLALRMTDCAGPMLQRFFEGTTTLASVRPQDLSKRSYFGHPTRRQMRDFHRAGLVMKDRASAGLLRARVAALVSA